MRKIQENSSSIFFYLDARLDDLANDGHGHVWVEGVLHAHRAQLGAVQNPLPLLPGQMVRLSNFKFSFTWALVGSISWVVQHREAPPKLQRFGQLQISVLCLGPV